ncbi:MAG: hypothetical protein EZS28_002128 [Streblomastix strix]|uniref:Reverse transcriptase domain-containing protein n=1 Tax=Streblomastix strix TaxID=222440 RepID=A0A5J4X4Y3_9EUKA|nr:MAG: hypothetical protein EZS28_002128 [Streblomastix strix]
MAAIADVDLQWTKEAYNKINQIHGLTIKARSNFGRIRIRLAERSCTHHQIEKLVRLTNEEYNNSEYLPIKVKSEDIKSQPSSNASIGHEIDKLKPLITDTTLEIHTKFSSSRVGKNLLNFILVFNHLDPTHLDQDDRRYLKVVQDLITTFEGLLLKRASIIDMLSYTLYPVARQKLFEEIARDGANIIFPMPEVGPLLKEEGPGYARKYLESIVAVIQEMAMLINEAARNETNNLIGRMLKAFEASYVSVADSQVERESRLKGVFQGPIAEDVLSLPTKERFKRKSGKQINIGGRKFGNIFTRYNCLNRGRKRQNKRNFGFKPRGDLIASLSQRASNSIITRIVLMIKLYLIARIRIQLQSLHTTLNLYFTPLFITIKYIPSIAGDQPNAVRRDVQSFDPANKANESRIKSVRRDRISLDPDQSGENEPVCRDEKSLDLAKQQAVGEVRWRDGPLDPAIQEKETIKYLSSKSAQRSSQSGVNFPNRRSPDSNQMGNRRKADPFMNIWKLIKAETLITRESIQRELRSTRSTNFEGAAGRNSQGRKMENDNRLLSIEQTSPFNTFQNGRYSKSLTTTATQGLHGKIDLESAFHHIQVDQDFRPFLGFTFNHKYYQNKAMCFGVKHAPLIFHKTLLPVIKFIREVIHVRIIAYCDDIIISHQNQEELICKKQLIIIILTNFGFKISMNKSQTKEDKPNAEQMEKDCNVLSNGESEIPGQFHRVSQFPATIIQEKLNQTEEVKQDRIMDSSAKRLECIGISEYVDFEGDILVEVDDASLTDWEATLKLQDSAHERDAAAILCALCQSVSYLKERQIKSLKIETDNSLAAYNFNRGSAAVALTKFVDRTLETAEVLNLQLHTFHIQRVTNRIPNLISKLATLVSYSLHQEVFEQALRSLKIRPLTDMFANRRNRKLKQFANMILDSQAMGQDCMSLTWKRDLPYLHSPLPMILTMFNKVRDENVTALIVVPCWPSQSWWPSLMELSTNYVNLGKSADVLKPGVRMRKAKKHLPPGELLAVRLEVTEERNRSNGYFRKGNSLMVQQYKLLMDGIAFGADIGKEQESLKSSGLNLECHGKF